MFSQLVTYTLLLVTPLVCHPTSNGLVVRSAHSTGLIQGANLDGFDLGRRKSIDEGSSRPSAELSARSTNRNPSTHDVNIISSYAQKRNAAQNLSRQEIDKSGSALEAQKFTPDQLDTIRLIQDELLVVDAQCQRAADNDEKTKARSLELVERVNIGGSEYNPPSDIMWSARWRCLVVDMYLSDYHPWTGTNQVMIGTRGLCGCIPVAIVGSGGAVVSHLAALLDMKTQLDLMTAKYRNMAGQHDIQAWVFTPRAGGNVNEQMAAAARVVATQVRDYISLTMSIPVVLGSYEAGGNSPAYARFGTLVATTVQGAIKLWVNDLLMNG